MTPRSARRSAAAGGTTPCPAASAQSCPPAAGRSTSSASTRPASRRAHDPRACCDAPVGSSPGGSLPRRGDEERLVRIAVPRGAMFKETLDLLDTLGVDTAEVRANDRKLL